MAVLLIVLSVAGCRYIEPEPEMAVPIVLPESYTHLPGPAPDSSASRNIQNAAPGDWWHQFNNAELSDLIETGLSSSYNLKALKARADQAWAAIKGEKSGTRPTLDYSLEAERIHTRSKTKGNSAQTGHGHDYTASLGAGYTLDLWGKNSAGIKAQQLEYEAACQDLGDAALALTCDIADTWVDILSVRKRMAVLERQIEANRMNLKLQELRFINGNASALDVSQQREALAQVLSALPLLEKNEKQLVNALNVFLGRTVGTPVTLSTEILPDSFFAPQPGIPSDLLENRADIRAARLRLDAAVQDVEAAKADMMPDVTLSASAVFSSGTLDLLFQNWVMTLGAALAGPLIDGGERKAEIERTRAVVREVVNEYAGIVAGAMCEVEDTLVAIDRQNAYIRQLEQQLTAVRVTMQDARVQYLNGQSSYLNYLAAWASLESLERQIISEKASYVKERIALYRVTGWQGAYLTQTFFKQPQDPKNAGVE